MLQRGSPLAIIIVGALLIGTGMLSPLVAQAQFTSHNVSQHAWLDLSALSASAGNDCWGYTSPSGREYALMGVNNKLSVVEITTPTSPVIVGTVSHSSSSWADIKVYGTHCYVVNESGGGLDVVDLSNVDSGTVTLVQRYTGGGLSRSHNVAINTDSGFLYLIGSNLNGGAPVVLSLANPAAPVEVGRWTEATADYHHDAHIVSYTSGPYAGMEILFGFSAGRGLDIVDVTDKANITLLSRTPYPGVQYCHQGWTSPDLRFLYVDDELDEGVTTPTTRTLIFDIADLSNPFLASTFTTGLPSRDHNLYVRDCVVYEANYSTGLRVINISDPLNPVEVGFYDTYPQNDNVNFSGAWSVYPFFPSGTVIISDINRGLFVLDVSAALAASAAIPGGLVFDFPSGVPTQIDPAGGTTMPVNLSGTCGGIPQAGTGQLHYDVGAGLVTVPMADLGGDQYEATFPAVTCPDEILFYVSAQSTDGGTFTSPPDAPATLYSATAALGTIVLFADNFETDTGWIATNTGASSGDWERGVPVNDPGWQYDPISDSDGSGKCYLTENVIGNSDVDGHGELVRLTSPALDLSGAGVMITYDYYLYLTDADGVDKLLVEIISLGQAGPWVEIARHDTSGGLSWRTHVITENDIVNAGVTLTSNMIVRFTINDDDAQSIVEAGLDAFAIQTFDCGIAGESCTDGILNQDEVRIDCGGVCPACTCTTDGLCDNGDFCDGAETCDAFGECQTGADPCPGQGCDEVNDVCLVPATIVSGRSCMMHDGQRWCFDLDGGLPDPRLGPAQLELDLTGDVSSVSASMSCASGHNGGPIVSIGSGLNGPQSRLTVDFTPLPNIDCCTVTLSGDAVDQYDISTLAGDVNGSGLVNATDKNLVKGNIANAVDAVKFVFDVNASGVINATDKNLAKGWIGTSAVLCP